MADLTAQSSIVIDAPAEKVWEALTTSDIIKQYFYGVDTITDWKVGSEIRHRGMWNGKPFEDKGIVKKFDPPRELAATHWSPLSDEPDLPENYHTVTYTVTPRGSQSEVSIANDHNPNEESRDHSAQNWAGVLKSLKELLEK